MNSKFTEKDVENHICRKLRQWGIPYEAQVICTDDGHAADIVTPDMVIEVKKSLNRSAIYQALGQAKLYSERLGRPKIKIIGLSPISEKSYLQAERLKQQADSPTCEIIFIDKEIVWEWYQPEPVYEPSYSNNYDDDNIFQKILVGLGIVGVVIFFASMMSPGLKTPSYSSSHSSQTHYQEALAAIRRGDYDSAAINFNRLAKSTDRNCVVKYANAMENASLMTKKAIGQGEGAERVRQVFVTYERPAVEEARSVNCQLNSK